ncbi:hypothetical protein CAPTEDRAFT_220472 [Capitella teleta]|uniref:Ig-like domain-containing protein n=1 Tax=Capitella teleta TaxID=283909 RepID=R7U8W7_CAPTE|nr:hypothetical protein CAPTEDRAFT_220472 [Capitella teleta]|eukprot:ELU02571.1 hypothetical protein CAPTEDRAFT_220472 [Capitella teleta]
MSMSAVAAASAEPDLEISQTGGGAKQGEEIVIRCSIKNIGSLELLQIVRKINGVETKIVSNAYINKQFLDTGRYTLSNQITDKENKYRMSEVTIKGKLALLVPRHTRESRIRFVMTAWGQNTHPVHETVAISNATSPNECRAHIQMKEKLSGSDGSHPIYGSEIKAVMDLAAYVQGEDGGDIGCGVKSSDAGAYDNVLIHVPVKSVDILYRFGEGANASYMSATEGEVLQLKQGQLANIICRVKVDGSDLDPVVDVTLDDKDASGVFVALPPTRNRVDRDGFLDMNYTGEWEYKTAEHDVSLNGQNFTCTAEKKKYPVVSRTIALQVIYQPVLDCAEEHAHELGTKEAKITCRARMNPKPKTVLWSWGSHPNRTELMNGDTAGKYTAEHKVLDDDHHEFSLVIDEITEDDFRKYKLEIANTIGTKEHELSLLEVEEVSTPEVIYKPPQEVGDPASVGKQVENEGNILLSTALLLVVGLLLSLVHAS